MTYNRISTRSLGALCVLAASLAFSAHAYAAPDRIYPNSAAWSVNSLGDGEVTNSLNVGADGSTTLNTDVSASDSISVAASWAIQDNSGPANNTTYPRAVTFSAATTQKPVGASDVVVSSITNCNVSSASSTCLRHVDFVAPATPGGYQVTISLFTGGGGTGQLQPRSLAINFSVAEDVINTIDTKLTVDAQCHVLNSGNVNLTATLEETFSEDPVADAQIDFYIDPPSATIGSANTGTNGVAMLSHNIDGFGVGDYNLYAEYLGDELYNGSNDSNTLGITYFFAGFRPPVNADGTSIFGGRVIPVKLKLLDANGNPVTDAAPTVWLTSFDKDLGLGEVLEEATSVSAADVDNIMRYSANDEQYIYNYDASGLVNGTYAIVVDLGDSATCRTQNPYAMITVARKGGGKK